MERFQWASYGMYFLGGMAAVIFGSLMPKLVGHYHTTYTTGGFVVFMHAIGFMAGVPVVAYGMNRFHYKYILTGCAFAVAVAQLSLLFLPPLKWVCLVAVLNGIGASGLETAVASYIMEVYVGQRAIFMSRLEVSFGLGALCLPLFSSILIALGLWRLAFLVVGALALVLAFTWQSISIPLQEIDSGEQLDATPSLPPDFRRPRTKRFVLTLFLLMIFFYVGLEGSLNSFLPSVFTSSLKVVPYYASASVSVFWVAMVFGRVAIGWVARRVNYERYLLWSTLLTLLFLLGIVESRNLWASFAVVLGVGLSMSAIYSITMVYANHTFPGQERTTTSLVTAFAGIGGAVFPALTGYAMDHLPPNHIFWLFVAFTGLLLSALLSIFATLRELRTAQS